MSTATLVSDVSGVTGAPQALWMVLVVVFLAVVPYRAVVMICPYAPVVTWNADFQALLPESLQKL